MRRYFAALLLIGLRDYGTSVWEGGDPACDHLQAGGGVARSTLGAASGGADMTDAARERSTTRSFIPYQGTCGKCGATRAVDKQIGLEGSPAEYIEALVDVLREVRRVLRDDGVVWLNLGDSYANDTKWGGSSGGKNELPASGGEGNRARRSTGLKPKDLMMMPARVALALQDDGWYLRSEVVWKKPNPMPESVTDRPTSAHEKVFLLTKRASYFFDADAIRRPHKHDGRKATAISSNGAGVSTHENYENRQGAERWPGVGANAHNVWEIATESTPFAHFATFPQALVERCIKAGTSEHGCCAECGAPWKRSVVSEQVASRTSGPNRAQNDDGAVGGRLGKTSTFNTDTVPVRTTTGWEPTCACGGVEGMADAFEVIETPTGTRSAPDPSMVVGRGGLARPRGENEGRRPITRFEQRAYADQLRLVPEMHAQLRAEVGDAFDHYVRKDRAGARPIPDGVLDGWISQGVLARVDPPTRKPLAVVPCTVLDPFMGSGTTAVVARRLGRHSVGIELSDEYIEISKKRLQQLSLLG